MKLGVGKGYKRGHLGIGVNYGGLRKCNYIDSYDTPITIYNR